MSSNAVAEDFGGRVAVETEAETEMETELVRVSMRV
jgi:hypothetical protein